jgi:sugar lactone lactonase YvrE
VTDMRSNRRTFLRTSAASLAAGFVALRSARADEAPAVPPVDSPLRMVAVWGKQGTGPGEFNLPIGIALGPRGEVFVADIYNNRVQRFTPDGKFLGEFPVPEFPGGIAVDRDGLVYVAPMMSHKICVYSPDGKLVRDWGKKGTGDGDVDQPGGIAIAPDRTVYVADQVNRRMQRFTPEGQFICKWGEYGDKPGQFDGKASRSGRVGGPNFVAVDPAGCVYTTEATLGRVQRFSPEGRPLLAFGHNSTEPGGFGGGATLIGPIAVCLDRQQRIWVSATNHRVQRFTATGKFIDGATSLTSGEGPSQFSTPHGVVIDGEGNLYVADSRNYRIQKFAVAEPR